VHHVLPHEQLMAKMVSIHIQILLLLTDPILVANIRVSALLLEIRMELLMLNGWLRYVLETLPIYSIIVALREVRHRHKLTRLVRYDRLRLSVTIALIHGRRHHHVPMLAIAC
jgi:hypothetical protein